MDDSIYDYIEEHSDREPEALHRVWRRSNLRLVGGRMCSGALQGRLLRMLVEISGARRILELGTFTAYATVCLAEGLPEGDSGAKVTTLEANDEMEPFIRQTLRECGVEQRVELIVGPALESMAAMGEGSVDLMFIDADKREYPQYYKEARRLVRPGGLILADNTLWAGHVADPAYDRDPQTRGIREFNRLVAEDCGVEKVMLPLRDGLTLIRVK